MNDVLGYIRSVVSRSREVEEAPVRPALEGCVHCWAPKSKSKRHGHARGSPMQGQKGDGLERLSHEERLQELGLSSLEHRRLNGISSIYINT